MPTSIAGAPPLRAAIWALHIALPLVGLWLLIARPDVDGIWEDHVSHFWLVAGVAVISVLLSLRIGEEARRRVDARLFLVSLAFLSSAGFLALHALATPGVVLSGRNGGFIIATPVGLVMASCFAVLSSIHFSPRASSALLERERLLVAALLVAMAAWAVVSLLDLPPLDVPLRQETAHNSLIGLAVPGVALYLLAAARYYLLHRRRPAVMLISVITAFVLLSEALVAMTYARNWHASWWEWHLLMAAGFGFVAYSAQVQYWHEGTAAGLFNAIALEQTVRQVRQEYAAALDELVLAIQRRVEREDAAGGEPALASRLGGRFGLSDGQVHVLEEAGRALAEERQQVRRLDALVSLGHESRVLVDEAELIRRAAVNADAAAGRHHIRIGVLHDGVMLYTSPPSGATSQTATIAESTGDALRSLAPVELTGHAGHVLILPLTVKRAGIGVIEVVRARGEFTERDRALLESFANQLSVAIENARLYRQIDSLFRTYMSPDVATALIANPAQAALGGALTEVTVLFADLRGYTSFSERASPQEVISLLNDYFGRAVPRVLDAGGTITQFIGDAIVVLFNAPARQPDHALRAARAALSMQACIEEVARDRADAPRFRVGLNTGVAVVGNIGSHEMRHFTAIGDTVNLAARLQTSAEPGQVVIGAVTRAALGEAAVVEPLAPLEVKGKAEPVEAYVLLAIRATSESKQQTSEGVEPRDV